MPLRNVGACASLRISIRSADNRVLHKWTHTHARTHAHTHTSRESWILRLKLLCMLMMCTNNRVHYGLMVVYGYLKITLHHYHHYADLYGGIELLKCLSGIFYLECVSKIGSVRSIVFYTIYGTVCLSLPISLKMIAKIPVIDLIIII